MTPTFPCPLTLEKILVCTDDSPASQGAVKTALDLAQACGARIVLLFALEFYPFYEYPQPDALGVTPAVGQDLLELRQQAAREHLEAWEQEAAQQNLTLQARLQTGTRAYAEILDAAEELQPDLIIMGRRGKSGEIDETEEKKGLDQPGDQDVQPRLIGHAHEDAPNPHVVIDLLNDVHSSDNLCMSDGGL